MGVYKGPEEYLKAFERISALPGNFTAVRTYSTQEKGHYRPLNMILDASKVHSLDLLLGLYMGHSTVSSAEAGIENSRFATEFDQLKQGLEYANSIGAIDNIIGISVGNEDLYRRSQRPEDVAAMIQKVQTYLKTKFPNGTCIPVGHTDTYTEIMNPSSAIVAEVSDFLAANSFPYWEEKSIDFAAQQFTWSMTKMDELATEGLVGLALGSVENLQSYWTEVVCSPAFGSRNAFYYIDEDFGWRPDGPPWGIFDEQGNAKIRLECPGEMPA